MSAKSASNRSRKPAKRPKRGRPPKWGEEHVHLAEAMLSRRFTKGQVKELLRKHFEAKNETVSPRTLETILARARENLVERSGKPRELHRDDAYHFYTSVLQAKDATHVARIRAQERIDKLLGLEAPTKLELAGKDGGPVKVDLSRVSTDDLEALERIAQATVADDPDAAGGAGPAVDPGGEGQTKPP